MAPGSTMLGMNMQMMNADGSFDVGGLTPGVWTISVMRAQGQLQTLVQSTVVISNRDVTDLNLMFNTSWDDASEESLHYGMRTLIGLLESSMVSE